MNQVDVPIRNVKTSMQTGKCPCKPGTISSNCPFSYSNQWHSRRDAMLLQTSSEVFELVSKLTNEQQEKLKEDNEYLLDDE